MTQAIPQMLQFTHSDELKEALINHLEETKNQIKKLDAICKSLDVDPSGKTCVGMEGLIEEATELMQEATPSWALDAGLVACAQKIEHYEIAGYGTAAAYAKQMGHDEALNTLLDILNEEKKTDQELSSLAEGLLNKRADQGMQAPQAL